MFAQKQKCRHSPATTSVKVSFRLKIRLAESMKMMSWFTRCVYITLAQQHLKTEKESKFNVNLRLSHLLLTVESPASPELTCGWRRAGGAAPPSPETDFFSSVDSCLLVEEVVMLVHRVKTWRKQSSHFSLQ